MGEEPGQGQNQGSGYSAVPEIEWGPREHEPNAGHPRAKPCPMAITATSTKGSRATHLMGIGPWPACDLNNP